MRARGRASAPDGIEVTPVEDYFERLADFAVAADWGRSPPSRSQVVGRT